MISHESRSTQMSVQRTSRGAARTALLGIVALATASFALVACTRTGVERTQDTGKSLDSMRVQVNRGGKQIDETLSSLAALSEKPQEERQKSFAKFSDQVPQIHALAKDIDGQAKDLVAQRDVYLKNWDSDNALISDQDMRAKSTDRRNTVQKRFSEVTNAYEDTKKSLQPFVSNLTDIQRSLSNDLSATGVNNVAPAAIKAKEQGAEVKLGLTRIKNRIDELSTLIGTDRKS
jgi:hypothetical protein